MNTSSKSSGTFVNPGKNIIVWVWFPDVEFIIRGGRILILLSLLNILLFLFFYFERHNGNTKDKTVIDNKLNIKKKIITFCLFGTFPFFWFIFTGIFIFSALLKLSFIIIFFKIMIYFKKKFID